MRSVIILLGGLVIWAAGDDVRLREAEFVRLCKAFFSEIEQKYL